MIKHIIYKYQILYNVDILYKLRLLEDWEQIITDRNTKNKLPNYEYSRSTTDCNVDGKASTC